MDIGQTMDAQPVRNPLQYDTYEGSDDSDSTIDRDIRDSMEIIMWNTLATPQCSPVVRDQLHRAGLILATNEEQAARSTILMREQLIEMTLTPPVKRDIFNPMTAATDPQPYLWFTWHSAAQYDQYLVTGTVPGYKDTRGDNVHRHHRLHNSPDHCVNLLIHTRWNAAADNTNYGVQTPIYLLVWKTSINNVLTNSHARANAHSSILQWTGSNEPQFPRATWKTNRRLDNGRLAQDRQQCVDNPGWTIQYPRGVTETQWHLNEYSAITMLNTKSLRRTFRDFCENNGLSTMLYKYMENDGTMKPQYVTGDNGIEHDHKQAMAPHKWNRPEAAPNAVCNGQHMSMRVGTPPDSSQEMQ
eukprot:6491169-Amphidinium_carterae.3